MKLEVTKKIMSFEREREKRERGSVYRGAIAGFDIAWLCLRSTLKHSLLVSSHCTKINTCSVQTYKIKACSWAGFSHALRIYIDSRNGGLGGLHDEGNRWGKGLRIYWFTPSVGWLGFRDIEASRNHYSRMRNPYQHQLRNDLDVIRLVHVHKSPCELKEFSLCTVCN